jgi:hypothetical protein
MPRTWNSPLANGRVGGIRKPPTEGLAWRIRGPARCKPSSKRSNDLPVIDLAPRQRRALMAGFPKIPQTMKGIW